MLRGIDEFSSATSISIGPAACVSRDVDVSLHVRSGSFPEFATSVSLGMDPITRLSVVHVERLIQDLKATTITATAANAATSAANAVASAPQSLLDAFRNLGRSSIDEKIDLDDMVTMSDEEAMAMTKASQEAAARAVEEEEDVMRKRQDSCKHYEMTTKRKEDATGSLAAVEAISVLQPSNDGESSASDTTTTTTTTTPTNDDNKKNISVASSLDDKQKGKSEVDDKNKKKTTNNDQHEEDEEEEEHEEAVLACPGILLHIDDEIELASSPQVVAFPINAAEYDRVPLSYSFMAYHLPQRYLAALLALADLPSMKLAVDDLHSLTSGKAAAATHRASAYQDQAAASKSGSGGSGGVSEEEADAHVINETQFMIRFEHVTSAFEITNAPQQPIVEVKGQGRVDVIHDKK
jgi:hypothetical protein